MGYRQYIVKIEKEKVDAIRHFSQAELKTHFKEIVDMDGYISMGEVLDTLEADLLYNLGEDFSEETYFEMTKELFFTNKEVAKSFSEYDPRILGEDAFLKIAENYEAKVKRHFDLLLTPPTVRMYDDFAERPIKENPILPSDSNREFLRAEDVLQHEYITKRIVEDFLFRQRQWELNFVMNRHKENETLNNTSLYEYSIFDMLRLHKTADFEKYYYVIYGY